MLSIEQRLVRAGAGALLLTSVLTGGVEAQSVTPPVAVTSAACTPKPDVVFFDNTPFDKYYGDFVKKSGGRPVQAGETPDPDNSNCVYGYTDIGGGTPDANFLVFAREQLDTFYPDLKKSGIAEQSATKLTLASKIPTGVFNYTNARLNIDSITKIYDFLDSITETSPVQLTPYSIKGGQRYLRFEQKDFTRSRLVLLLPPSAPKMPNEGEYSGTYYHLANEGTLITKHRLNSPDRIGMTSNFAVEACQATLTPQPMIKDGNQFTLDIDGPTNQNAQEVGCNGLGIALEHKARVNSYAAYKDLLKGFQSVDPSWLLVSEAAYNSMPHFELVI